MVSVDLHGPLPGRYLELARVCDAVYAGPVRQDYHSFESQSFSTQKIVHGSFERGFCRIFTSDSHIVIAFRGTREKIDWKIANLRFLPVPIKGSKFPVLLMPLVHRGFQSCLYAQDKTTDLQALSAIIGHLDEMLSKKERRIIITGHSLGGALAILLSVKIALVRPDIAGLVEEVVTFGAPATGFGRLKRAIKKQGIRTTRIVNGVDLVSFLPPAFYRHAGDELWLRPDRIERQPSWLRRMIVGRFTISRALADHAIENYVTRLSR